MRLLQHVYGRVSRGFEGSMPGYQLAALSPELRPGREILECLNRLSFCRAGSGSGAGSPRQSFFRAGPGFLAVGQVQVASDLSGATGSLAHHYVFSEEEFVRSGCSPVHLLRHLRFFSKEGDLPEERELAPKEWVPSLPPDTGEAERERALKLVARIFGGDRLRVPLLVLPEEELWPLLDATFGLLPRSLAAELSFSTLFVDCSEFIMHYRLVSVPDLSPSQRLPQVLEPFPPDAIDAIRDRHELSEFWRQHPANGKDLLALANSLRYGPAPGEPGHPPPPLATGSDFRQVIERLQLARPLYPLLLTAETALATYWNSGSPLPWSELEEAVWKEPETSLPVFARFLRRTDAGTLREDSLLDIGRRLASGRAEAHAFLAILEAGLAKEFYATCARRLEADELMSLAERLGVLHGYGGEVHRTLVERLLGDGIPDSDSPRVWSWMRRNAAGDGLIRAAVAVDDGWSSRLPELPDLAKFGLGDEGFECLVPWMWNRVARTEAGLAAVIGSLFRTRGHAVLWAVVTRRAARLGGDDLAGILAMILKQPFVSAGDESIALELVQSHPSPRRVASRLLKKLEREKVDSPALVRRLEEVIRRHGLRAWLSRLLGGDDRSGIGPRDDERKSL